MNLLKWRHVFGNPVLPFHELWLRRNIVPPSSTVPRLGYLLFSALSQSYWSEILGLTTQSDGKTIVVGTIQLDNALSLPFNLAEFELHWLIARYNTDGTIDTTFGSFGYVIVTWDSQGSSEAPGHEATDVKVLGDGTILVAGVVTFRQFSLELAFQMGVVRLDSSGVLDETFGTNGRTSIDLGGAGYWSRTKLGTQSDGKIILATTNYQSSGALNRMEVWRLTSAGAVDATFGTSGKTATQYVSLKPSNCWAMIVDSNDKIVMGGSGTDALDVQGWHVCRFLANGSADTGFGGAGADGNAYFKLWDYSGGYVFDLRLRSNGKVVCIGNTPYDGSGHEQMTVLQLTTSGGLDTTWASGAGFVHINLSGDTGELNNTVSAGLVLAGDDMILLGGAGGDSGGGFSDANLTISALLTDAGVYDTYTLYDHGTTSEIFYNATLSAAGAVFGGGHLMNDATSPRKAVGYLAKLTSSGALDTTFGDIDGDSAPTAPSVTTDAASAVTVSTATLNATINPNGTSTNYHFLYGTTDDGTIATASASAGSGSSPVAVSANVTGLSSGTQYFVRCLASNGTFVRGSQQNFTTDVSLLPNLSAYWEMADATDSHTNGYDLTNNGTVTFGGTGIQGNCAEFSGGTTKYLSLADNADIRLVAGNDWSMSCWVNFNSVAGNAGIAHKGTDSSWQMQLWWHAGAGIKFTLYNGSSWIDATWAVTPNTAQWYHLVGQYDATNNKVILWVDGVLRAQPSLAGTLAADTNLLRLGRVAGINNLDGLLDEVAIWQTLLTEAQILALYNSGSGVGWPLT